MDRLHHHHRRSHVAHVPNKDTDILELRDPLLDSIAEPERNANLQERDGPSVVYVTAAKTFDGPAVWVTQDANDSPKPTKASQQEAKTTGESSAKETGKTSKDNENNKDTKESTATKAPLTSEIKPTPASSSFATLAVASGAGSQAALSSSTAATSSSDDSSSSASGMSSGAKAGLAVGILVVVGAILAIVLLLYKKKKRAAQKTNQPKQEDNEKAVDPFADPAATGPRDGPGAGTGAGAGAGAGAAFGAGIGAASTTEDDRRESILTTKTAENAPRLSLRPLTQFSPDLGNPKNFAQEIDQAATNASQEHLASIAPRPSMSAWERPGAANNAEDPTNPFGNHAETVGGAITSDRPVTLDSASGNDQDLPIQGRVSTSQDTAAKDGPRSPSSEKAFAAGAAMAAATMAGAGGAAMLDRKPLNAYANQKPLSQVPPSPAWTESSIPASPGPAPSGALPPIAGATGGAPPQSPGVNNVHRVQMDFKPSMDDELEVFAGQLVRMLHEYDDGWALCVRMDRSQQGVAPRSCLSKTPVRPRPAGPPRGPPPPRPPHAPPMSPAMGSDGQPMSPAFPQPPQGRNSPNGRNSPGPFADVPRPLSTTSGRSSPNAAGQGRPMSPSGRPMSPGGPPMSPPGGRRRANSNNIPYRGPGSPGPRSPTTGRPMSPQDKAGRRRSNSASQAMARPKSPPGPSPMNPNALPLGAPMPPKKPVPGQAF